MDGLFRELKRRNVFRMAVTYLVAAWVVAQVAGLSADAFEAPAWVMRMIISGLVIGFVPAIIFAWVFEITPEGIKRERDLVGQTAAPGQTARKLDIAVIIMLVAAIGLLLGDRFLLTSSPPSPQPDAETWQLDSIAVLPFADFSPNRDQAWLGEGIAETLLHALAQIDGLRVSARTSSFAYRDRDADIGTIGRELNVATVLEGSVQRAGNQLRIVAQLVRTDDHNHIFSKTFNRDADDIFAIQDEIAQAVADALMGAGGPSKMQMATTSTDVYDLYMEGRQLWQQRTETAVDRAVDLLTRAVATDPYYGPAHSELATAMLFQTFYGTAKIEDVQANIQTHVRRALAINTDDAQAWATRGLLLQELGLHSEALEALHKAEKLGPNDANIQVWLGNRYQAMTRFDQSAAYFERALELDPLNRFVRGRYAQVLGIINPNDPRIERIARDSARLFPDHAQSWYTLLNLLTNQNRLDETILIGLEALELHPDAGGFMLFIAGAFNVLKEYDIAEQWIALNRQINPDLEPWSHFYLRHDPNRHLELAREDFETRGIAALPNLLSSLRINGHIDEAWELSQVHFDHVVAQDAAGGASMDDYNVLLDSIWLARQKGTPEDVERRRELAVRKIDEVRESGALEDFILPDLAIAAVLGQHETVLELLPNIQPSSYYYMAWSLEHDPMFAEVAHSPEAQTIIDRAEQRRVTQLERVRNEAPAAFEPAKALATNY